MKKLLAFVFFAGALFFTLTAQAQEFHGAFGFGSIKAPSATTDSSGTNFPSVSGGLYPSFSGFFILKHHIGFGGEAAWRAHQAVYTATGSNFLFQAPYRPIFYDFDAVYGAKFNKKFGGDVIERLIPSCRLAMQHRPGQPIGQGQAVLQRRALGA